MMFVVKNWRWILALTFFLCGWVGFMSGVQVSQIDLTGAHPVSLMYYSLGLFILGGMDIGVPVGGPDWGRGLLWLAYFGAPLLMTSAILEWLMLLMSGRTRWLRSLNNHTIIIGVSDLTRSIMGKVENLGVKTQLVVVERDILNTERQELAARYGARCLAGDFTNEYFLGLLKLEKARRIIIASEENFDNYETASKILEMHPDLIGKIIVHSNRLRFQRQMSGSRVGLGTQTFNSYHLAARHLVRNVILGYFEEGEQLDTVVIGGFGVFGQTVLEELQRLAIAEHAQIAIIDTDVQRRLLVAEEQAVLDPGYHRHLFEGDLGHPDVWRNVEQNIDLTVGRPLVLMVSSGDEENIRAGVWFSNRHENARILVRTQRGSHFAESVAKGRAMVTFGLTRMFQESIPDEWFMDPESESA